MAVEENTFPTVRFMLRSGHTVAAALGVIVVIGGLWLASAGQGWAWAVAGVVVGAVTYGFVRLLVELLQIIADTLLPQ
jgi:hypothetical protein